MSRPRLYADAAAKQRTYRERIKARRRAQQGPTEKELALAVRDLHIRLEYEAATNPTEIVLRLAGRNPLETLHHVVKHILEQFQ